MEQWGRKRDHTRRARPVQAVLFNSSFLLFILKKKQSTQLEILYNNKDLTHIHTHIPSSFLCFGLCNSLMCAQHYNIQRVQGHVSSSLCYLSLKCSLTKCAYFLTPFAILLPSAATMQRWLKALGLALDHCSVNI